MKITLAHLKKAWNIKRLQKIRSKGFVIASDQFFHDRTPIFLIDFIDAVWSDYHDQTLNKKRSNEILKHIFISQICKVAVEEYATVCKLLKVKNVIILGDKKFVQRSKDLLSHIPGVTIIEMIIKVCVNETCDEPMPYHEFIKCDLKLGHRGSHKLSKHNSFYAEW